MVVYLEQVTFELVPNSILKEEGEDSFYQWTNTYDQWNNNPCTPVEGNETGDPTLLMLTTVFST